MANLAQRGNRPQGIRNIRARQVSLDRSGATRTALSSLRLGSPCEHGSYIRELL